jgi:hypothetical protein
MILKKSFAKPQLETRTRVRDWQGESAETGYAAFGLDPLLDFSNFGRRLGLDVGSACSERRMVRDGTD